MTTYIYDSAHLSAKERLTISNLLGLFQNRLTAGWVDASRSQGKPIQLILIDLDRPEGPEQWERPNRPEARIAVTSDDRSQRHPFISRPIRAYGPNGVIVLFNSIAQSLSSFPRQAAVEPQREPARIRMMGRLESPPAPSRAVPALAAETPAPARVAVRWGPPQPVMLPPLMHMPSSRVHRHGQIEQQEEDLTPPVALPPAAAPPSPKSWEAPDAETLPPLVEMPTAHRPVEIHAPAARLNIEAETKTAQPLADVPTLRPSPPQWRAPEPELVDALIDFRSAPAFEPEPDLVSLAKALAEEAAPNGDDAAIDWWGTGDFARDDANGGASNDLLLIHALKAIKASAQPSILEIPGLPAICVIPARNVYFTTAPAARIEGVIGARADVAWRACGSEEEAREISGTQQSRQASLEQLSWTASLLAPPSEGIVDCAVRLRRWPPITESRGRSKFVRYATMLSGAQATPRELSEITGEPLDEVVSFVNACSLMNLLDTSGHGKAPLGAPVHSAGAGILRDMIEQLTPPKI